MDRPCREGQRAYRASAGVVVLEVLPLEVASNLLELRHAVLLALPESSTFGLSLNAQRADPVALWHLLQRRVQAEEVAAPIALVAQYDLRFVMATFAQLAIEREDVVRHSYARRAGLQLQKRLQGSVQQIGAEDARGAADVSKMLIRRYARTVASGASILMRFRGGCPRIAVCSIFMRLPRISAASAASSAASDAASALWAGRSLVGRLPFDGT